MSNNKNLRGKMNTLKIIQQGINRAIALENKKNILKKLEDYYLSVDYNAQKRAKELAVFAFWEAKKQGRLDNLNRIIKVNQGRT